MHFFRTDIIRSILDDKLDHHSPPVRNGHFEARIVSIVEIIRSRLTKLWNVRTKVSAIEDERAALYEAYHQKALALNATIEATRARCPHTSLNKFGVCKICNLRPNDPSTNEGIADKRNVSFLIDGPMFVDYETMVVVLKELFIGLPLVYESVDGLHDPLALPDMAQHFVEELNGLLIIHDKVYRLRQDHQHTKADLEKANTVAADLLREAQAGCPHRSLIQHGACQICGLQLDIQR